MTKNAPSQISELLLLAEQINGGPLPESIKAKIKSIEIDESKTAFENLPDSVVEELLGEAFDSTMGMPIPASLVNAGNALDHEQTHGFTKDNACPYFQKNELCALDGRICLYDTETFPVCPRYREGYSRGIAGLGGNKPTVPPSNEMPKDKDTSNPFATPYNRD